MPINRSPLNPGYKAIVKKNEFAIDAGQTFLCPKCGGILMEAVAYRLKMRCKHCGRWVYLEKIVSHESTQINTNKKNK